MIENIGNRYMDELKEKLINIELDDCFALKAQLDN